MLFFWFGFLVITTYTKLHNYNTGAWNTSNIIEIKANVRQVVYSKIIFVSFCNSGAVIIGYDGHRISRATDQRVNWELFLLYQLYLIHFHL
jgi:hypothetical protein